MLRPLTLPDEAPKARRETRLALTRPPIWKQAIEWLIERLPRRAIPFTVSPLRALREGHPPNGWISLSKSSAFKVHVDVESISGTWIYLEAALQRHSGDRRSSLMMRTKDSANESCLARLPGNLRGSIREVIYIPRNVYELSLIATESLGYFRLSHIAVHRITRLEAFIRMLDRVTTYRNLLGESKGSRSPGLLSEYERIRQSRYLRATSTNPSQVLRRMRASEEDFVRRIGMTSAVRSGVKFILLMRGIMTNRAFGALNEQSYCKWTLLDLDDLDSADMVADKNTWLVVLEDGDLLFRNALQIFAAKIEAAPPDCIAVYADNESIAAGGAVGMPALKPDWNPDLFFTHDYVGRPCALRLDAGMTGRIIAANFSLRSAPYEYLLNQCTSDASEIVLHVPLALGRSVSRFEDARTTAAATRTALETSLSRFGAKVCDGPIDGTFSINWALPSPPPLASLIIPTRDRVDLLSTCIRSIRAMTNYPAYEIIIVDNQSKDSETLRYLDKLRTESNAIRVIAYDAPFNFAAINNLAVRHARGDIIVFVNNDIEMISSDWLELLVRQACRPSVGAVGAKLLYPDGLVQHAGVILGIGGIAGHGHRFLQAADSGYAGRASLQQQLSAVTGALMAVRANAFRGVGGFDEQFKVAFNDVDLCLRLNAEGYRTVFEPRAIATHHESVSRGVADTPEKQKTLKQEQQLMRRRWSDILSRDPAYNPHLTLEAEDFSFARENNQEWTMS